MKRTDAEEQYLVERQRRAAQLAQSYDFYPDIKDPAERARAAWGRAGADMYREERERLARAERERIVNTTLKRLRDDWTPGRK